MCIFKQCIHIYIQLHVNYKISNFLLKSKLFCRCNHSLIKVFHHYKFYEFSRVNFIKIYYYSYIQGCDMQLKLKNAVAAI